MELFTRLSGIEWLAIIGAITAISKLIEALIKVDGPATLSIRWIIRFFKSIGAIEEIKAGQAEIKAEQAVMKSSLERIQHEVETNTGSSLKDAVKRKEEMIIGLTDLVKNQSNKLHIVQQRLENDEKFSSNLRFTVTPLGISKSNHAAKALFGYSDAEDAAGASISWQNSIPFQQRNNVIEQWRYAWQNKAIFECDFYILHADRNRAFYCHVEAVPICDLDGKLLLHSGSIAVLEKDIGIEDLKRRLRDDVQF